MNSRLLLGGVLGGYVGCRKGIERRCFRARVSAQGGDGVEQLAAVPDNTYAKILQVLRCQVRQDRVIDRVLAECALEMALKEVAIIVGQPLPAAARVEVAAERRNDKRLNLGGGYAADQSGRRGRSLQRPRA